MTSRKILLIIACICLLTGTAWSAKDIVAQVVFLSGKVQVTRNNKTETLRIGAQLENFDRIKVDKTGNAEIRIDPKTGISATLKLKAGTTLGLDISAMKSKQKGGVDLIAGSVECKVQKLTSGNSLDVRTGSANMGVRGTTFQVDVAAGGEVLLTTDEGRVECTTSNGQTLYSEPGKVVQGTLEEEWANIPVAVSSLATFRSKWMVEKIDAFRADPSRALTQFSTKYEALKIKFVENYKELLANRDVIRKWIKEEEAGNIGTMMERMNEKKALIGPLFKIRANLFMFERVYLRLSQISEMLGTGVPAGTTEDGRTFQAFLEDFNDEKEELAARVDDVNFIIKLYAKRNDGGFPLETTGTTGGSGFFTDSKGFFN